MNKRLALIGSIVVILILAVFGTVCFSHRSITLSINTEKLSYVICYSRGLGPRKLDYTEHQKTLDEIFDMVSGEYRYVRRENSSGQSGGGPYSIFLYDNSGELINTIRYMNGQLYIPANGNGKYYIYRNKNGAWTLQL